MQISFHGAAQEVTGSCALVESLRLKFLVDCGMFQGEHLMSDKNRDDFAFNPSKINFVLLTHAHLDHCGRLPKLYKDGFRGQVFCTPATADLVKLMLNDSVRLLERDALERNIEPLYKMADVLGLCGLLRPIDYGEDFRVGRVTFRPRDAGHILGSAIFEVFITEGLKTRKLVFSGDLGNAEPLIIKEAEFLSGADYLITESTYAGREHESKEAGKRKIRLAVKQSVGNHGVLMIPIFALEKSQEILFELNSLVEDEKVPSVPIFLDSPLAIKTVDVYRDYAQDYNRRSLSLTAIGDDLFTFPGMKYTMTKNESIAINSVPAPKVILAGSGMCTGGRIPHHLRLYLEDERSHLLIVSFQVKGSLGRQLLEGAKWVVIDGWPVKVKAQVSVINSYSSHADSKFLLRWIKSFSKPKPKKVFIVHGETDMQTILKGSLDKLGIKNEIAEFKKIYKLL